MKVTETIKKEFTPYKMSIKTEGVKFVLEYWVRKNFISIDACPDYIAHTENFDTLNEAIKRFNDTIKEIK